MIYKRSSSREGSLLVTFELPPAISGDSACLVGDFNAWNQNSLPMQRNGNGCWRITLELPLGKTFEFRYLIDGQRWFNDWEADRYVPNPYGGRNSVVVTEPVWQPSINHIGVMVSSGDAL